MPNIKSAEKRVRIAQDRNLRNRMLKSQLKTSMKKLSAAIAEGDAATAETLYRSTVGILDKAVLKGAMHRNTANRKKSQLAVALNKAKA
ncbi:MAG: 30S ribosomal protein S20 [Bacillota bacterium]